MPKKQAHRHGEILFIKTESIPKEAKLEESKNLLTGSHGNPHTYDKGQFYRLDKDSIFGYFEAKDTKLFHAEHGEGKGALKSCKLPDGIYELRKGQEFVNNGLIPIVD